jgi:hypothetical protein
MEWEEGYQKFGTSFYSLAKEVITHIKRAKYDRVIATLYDNWEPEDSHFECGIVNYVTQWENYNYGWCHEHFLRREKNNQEFVLGGNHSDYVLIAPWMKELKNHKISICGAFEGECIEDLEIALKSIKLNFRKLNHLIV